MTGVLVDPGASHSLIGKRTLGNFYLSVLKPRNMHIQDLAPTGKKVSGIDGIATESPGQVIVPLGLGPFTFHWKVDLMGTDSGQDCPGLLGQEILQAHGVTIHWHFFADGDALML